MLVGTTSILTPPLSATDHSLVPQKQVSPVGEQKGNAALPTHTSFYLYSMGSPILIAEHLPAAAEAKYKNVNISAREQLLHGPCANSHPVYIPNRLSTMSRTNH